MFWQYMLCRNWTVGKVRWLPQHGGCGQPSCGPAELALLSDCNCILCTRNCDRLSFITFMFKVLQAGLEPDNACMKRRETSLDACTGSFHSKMCILWVEIAACWLEHNVLPPRQVATHAHHSVRVPQHVTDAFSLLYAAQSCCSGHHLGLT